MSIRKNSKEKKMKNKSGKTIYSCSIRRQEAELDNFPLKKQFDIMAAGYRDYQNF